MLVHKLLSASLLAGVLPLVSAAQNTLESPRFYVGVGGSMLNGFSAGTSRLFGPSLTAGLQLNPRLAVQVGATFTWRTSSSSYAYVDSGQLLPTVYTNESRTKFITVPVLLRYTFTPAAKRIQLDALVGLSLLLATSQYTSSTTYNNQTQYADPYHYASFRGSLVLGPALRYALSSRVALTAEAPINLVLGNSYGSISNLLFYNLQVGARYSFG